MRLSGGAVFGGPVINGSTPSSLALESSCFLLFKSSVRSISAESLFQSLTNSFVEGDVFNHNSLFEGEEGGWGKGNTVPLLISQLPPTLNPTTRTFQPKQNLLWGSSPFTFSGHKNLKLKIIEII